MTNDDDAATPVTSIRLIVVNRDIHA